MRYLLIVLTVFLSFCGQNQQQSSSTKEDTYGSSNRNDSIDNANKEVYVCISGTAYAYHKNRNCRGLRSCTHRIETMTEKEAILRYKRKRCGYCYY